MNPASEPGNLAEVVRRAWLAGAEPDLAAVLRAGAVGVGEVVRSGFVDAIVEDAEQRWDRGLPATLEHYLAAIPDRAADPQAVRALLMLEYARRAAQTPALVQADLEARLPRFADEIKAVSELAALMRSQEQAGDESALIAGAVLGKFRLVEWLGAGSFGEVWCAWDTALERYVALKLLPPEEPGISMLGAVMREAKSAASIDHEHVVKVHDAGRFESPLRCFIDTQLVGDPAPTSQDPKRVAVGRSLSSIVSDPTARAVPHGIAPREAARLMEAVCRGAAAAHARGIVHRDIKPSNILVTPSGRPLLGDFGLSLLSLTDGPASTDAATTSDAAARATLAGRITGTPTFMAPEQAGGQSASPASDIYSLGATFRFLLTGKLPFEPSGRHSTDARWDVIEQVRRCELAPLATERPDLSRDVAAICDKAMSRDPGDRYISAAAMASDLAAFLGRRPVSARAAGPSRVALLWSIRNPAILSLTAAMVILGGIGLWRYVVSVGRERDRAVAAELATKSQLLETERARSTAESANAFLQSVLAAAQPDLLGRNATILDAVRLAARQLGSRFKDDPLVEADVRQTVGRIYGLFGETEEARSQLGRSIDLYRSHRGEPSPETLNARKSLAMLDWGVEPTWKHGLPVERIVDETRAALGPEHRLTLDAEADLASVYAADHRFERAHDLLARVAAAHERAGDRDSIAALQTLQMLAAAKGYLNRNEEALVAIEQLIERQKRVLGEDHYQRYISATELAPILEQLGRWEEAAAQWKLALDGLRPQLPRGHEYLYMTARGVASIYAGRLDRAREGFDIYSPVFADYIARPDHERAGLPSGYLTLAQCQLKLNDLAEAEANLLKARAGFAELLENRNNSGVRKVNRLLAELYERTGRPDMAKALRAEDAEAKPD